jgi:hypothetical protein
MATLQYRSQKMTILENIEISGVNGQIIELYMTVVPKNT